MLTLHFKKKLFSLIYYLNPLHLPFQTVFSECHYAIFTHKDICNIRWSYSLSSTFPFPPPPSFVLSIRLSSFTFITYYYYFIIALGLNSVYERKHDLHSGCTSFTFFPTVSESSRGFSVSFPLVLRFEVRALSLEGKHSIMWVTPPAHPKGHFKKNGSRSKLGSWAVGDKDLILLNTIYVHFQ
jgi:hypothetical protein